MANANRLHSPEEAIATITVLMAQPGVEETFVFLLDNTHHGKDVMCVSDAAWPEQVSRIIDVVLGAARDTWVGGLVMASVRPGGPILPDAEDLETWFDLRCRTDELGIDLIDWFLVIDDYVVSLAEYTSSTSLWING